MLCRVPDDDGHDQDGHQRQYDARPGYRAERITIVGLRVDQLRALGKLLPPMPPLTITLNGSGQPVISFTGVAGTSYPIQRSTELSSGWSEISTIVAGPGGAVQYTDTNPPAGRAYYRTAVLVP